MISRWGILATVAVGIPVFLIPLGASELGIRLAMNAEGNAIDLLGVNAEDTPMGAVVQTPGHSELLSANQTHSSGDCKYWASKKGFKTSVEL